MKWASLDLIKTSKQSPLSKKTTKSRLISTNPVSDRRNSLPKIFRGFTIVELLIVIVVIGVLAAITIVSYTGINNRAIVASLQSDLANASQQLKLYQVDNGAYPNAVTDCPSPSAGSICLATSGGNILSSYSVNNDSNPQTFSLVVSKNSFIYKATNEVQPVALASAPLSPVADWLAVMQGDHYGNYFDLVSKSYATVVRTTPKTIYDPNTQKIHDVPANYLAVNPRSDNKSGSEVSIEEARTNALLQSTFANQAALDTWSKSGGAKTLGGASSIYPSANEITFTVAGGDSARAIYRTLTTSGETRTFSAYIRLADGTAPSHAVVRGFLNSVTTYLTFSRVGDTTWYRAYATYTSASGANTSGLYALSSPTGQSFIMACPQDEAGTFPTSYIPTTTTAGIRNADRVDLSNSGLSGSVGTALTVSSAPLVPVTYMGTIWSLGSSNGDYVWQRYQTSTSLRGEGNGSAVASETVVSGQYNTTALVWSAGSQLIAFKDGASKVLSPSNFTGATPTYLRIAAWPDSTPAGLNTSVQRIVFYQSALPDADVLTVTDAIKDGP